MASNNDALTNILQSMMSGTNVGPSPSTSSAPTAGSVELNVATTQNISASSVDVILQGRRQTMSSETFQNLVSSGSTFRDLLAMKFSDSSARSINSVTVTKNGTHTTNYAIANRIPGELLENSNSLVVSFAVESGTNGN